MKSATTVPRFPRSVQYPAGHTCIHISAAVFVSCCHGHFQSGIQEHRTRHAQHNPPFSCWINCRHCLESSVTPRQGDTEVLTCRSRTWRTWPAVLRPLSPNADCLKGFWKPDFSSKVTSVLFKMAPPHYPSGLEKLCEEKLTVTPPRGLNSEQPNSGSTKRSLGASLV